MIDLLLDHILPAAYSLLPEAMASPAATAMLLSIGLQESRFEHRYQIHGPARSFWQFERIGVAGVLGHDETREMLREALVQLRYPRDLIAADVHEAMTHNDILAACVARCLLWTDPRQLPRPDQDGLGWRIYVATWAPGKPHPDTWRDNFTSAWTRLPTEGLHA